MRKVKEDRLSIDLELTRNSEGVVVSCEAKYEVASEGVTETRSFEPTLSQAQENAIRSFGAQVLQQIKQSEE